MSHIQGLRCSELGVIGWGEQSGQNDEWSRQTWVVLGGLGEADHAGTSRCHYKDFGFYPE